MPDFFNGLPAVTNLEQRWAAQQTMPIIDSGGGVFSLRAIPEAKPDGTFVDEYIHEAAIEAVARGVPLLIPGVDRRGGERWRVSGPPPALKGLKIVGGGRDALLDNDVASPTVATGTVFEFGWFHESYWDDVTTYAAEDIVGVTRFVPFINPLHAANFAVGHLAVIRETAEAVGDVPAATHMSRIVEIVGGSLVLAEPCTISMVDPVVWNATLDNPISSDGFARPVWIAEDIDVSNIAVRSLGYWMGRGAAYRSQFRDIFVERGGDLFNMNLTAFCRVHNIGGYFTNGIWESTHCIDSWFSGFVATYLSATDAPAQIGPGLSFGGTTRDVRFEDFYFNMADYSDNRCIRMLGERNRLRRGTVFSNQARLIELSNSGNEYNMNTDNEIEHVDFYGGPDVQHHILVGGGTDASMADLDPPETPVKKYDVTRPKVRRCNFYGVPTAYAGRLQDVVDGEFDNWHEGGSMNLIATATGNRVRGTVPGGFEGAGRYLNDIRDIRDPARLPISGLARTEPVSLITSTTSGNPVTTLDLPAGILGEGDFLEIDVFGEVPPGELDGVKWCRIKLADAAGVDIATIGSLSFSAAEVGTFHIHALIASSLVAPGTDRIDSYCTEQKNGVTTVTTNNQSDLSLETTAYRIEIQAWVVDADDSIRLTSRVVRPFRPTYA